ncbi:enhancer of mRNA-decapping protein 4-like [Mizuhopecten yessoensis]|uniref:Enhancer of mRNA-decapping protein 4 n=1 Tax=Mizuhopecten yessoensis TaxID=6573 RepID=A0A210QEI6_MIZYE|nr:enhancer of mRNA-decapping protein 4-like [Mizuhopecten yessoensis]OWF47144.1 Enhancer of mRNA-decapping protein 4 [Mizuhopecten yessoensis]
MDPADSTTSSLGTTGDTGHLLQELINLQKSHVMSSGNVTGSLPMRESMDPGNSGDGTAGNPTLTELMKTIYDSPAPRQLITLQGSDTVNSFSVYGREVDIMASKGSSGIITSTGVMSQSTTGSNKVKITPVVKYDWEQLHYIGNLVAIHKNSLHAAYTLRGKSGGIVRIINRRTAERVLLKDFTGKVIDIAFAHTDDVIFGAVDEVGNLFVYSIKETDYGKLVTNLVLHVLRDKDTPHTEYHRLIWCPFIPDDSDDSSVTESSTQDASRVLVLTHNEKAEIWNVDLVTKEYSSGPLLAEDVEFGLILINSHTQPIMDAAFSPDGTALATASLDGEVKFFQVNMGENTSPRCLHQWKPHDGKPLSSLFFLDDHKYFSADAQFWKFAVTGAMNNQELKIWTCESWTCLQTIRFSCPPGLPSNFQLDPCMKAALDLSAKYLVLSDIRRKVLYVLQIHQEGDSNAAHVSSVSEFLLAQPCLSFALMDASKKKFKKSIIEDDSHLDDITTGELERDENEDGDSKVDGVTTSGVQIKLYTVHPKTLQELQIRFRPESSAPPLPTPSVSTISHDDTGLQDGLSYMSISMEMSVTDVDSSKESPMSGQPAPVLLTPDVFKASPRKVTPSDNSILEPVRASAGSSTSSFTHVSGLNEDFMSPRSSGGDQSDITQTPTPKDPTPGRANINPELTPGSVPLPPVTISEEQELQTPKSKESLNSSGEVTPKAENRLANVCIDDLFDTQESSSRPIIGRTFDSTSSTTGFDVNDIVGPKHSSSKEYDEDDEEVAEVLGETIEEEEEEDSKEIMEGTQPFVEQGTQSSAGDSEGQQVLRAWPRPPDVNTEGQSHPQKSYEDEEEGDDDVQVEGEEICEEDEEEDEDDIVVGERKGEIDTQNRTRDESSEEIEEHIEEHLEEEEEHNSPKEAPVLKAAERHQISSPRDIPVPVREIHRETIREVIDKKVLSQLQDNLQSVLLALEAQNNQIQRLQDQLVEQQEQQAELQRQQIEMEQLRQMDKQPQPSIEEHLGKLESIVTSRVERMFSQHAMKENQRIQDLLQQTERRDQHRQDKLQQAITQTVNQAVQLNLEKQVKMEMRNTLVPNVAKILEPIKEQLHQDLAQKLTATDSLLKDNISKMVRSRQTVDAIGMAAGNALQTPIQVAYREAFQNIVVPNFERSTQNMFQQINETFTKGSREYIKHLDTHLDQVKQKHLEARDPVVGQLKQLTDSFRTSAESMQSTVMSAIQSQIHTDMESSMTSLQDQVVQFVRQAVKEEVSIAVREQGASISDSVLSAMRSGAVTPIQVTPDPHQAQTQILQLLRQGQLNAAFQEALSASNLDLVMFVCETVNPQQVFNQTPCPLQQPVLLSLIQQLSADLANSTELKHKYLEEAVMNMDMSNSVTREHLKGVLYGLIQKLKTYIASHPNAKTTRSLKMLQMASESLLK